MTEDPDEHPEIDEENKADEAHDSNYSVGEMEKEIDEAIHENDNLVPEKHDDEDIYSTEEQVETDDGTQKEEEEGEQEDSGDEEERNDGSKLEDEIVGVEIYKMESNLEIYRDLIIDCIDREYAKNMFMDQEIVVMICLGERYEIIERIYHNYLEKIHRIFDRIWKHKLTKYRETFQDDILLFFHIVRMITLKDLHLRKSLEVAGQKIKYTMDEKTFELIMEDISDEIDAYDEIRDKLQASKHKIQEHLDEREREKQEEMERLKALEEVEDDHEIEYEKKHHEDEEEEEGRDKGEFDDGYEEEATNLEDVSEEEATPEESEESKEDLSYNPEDTRAQYDSEDASVGPEGESTPSLDSSQKREALKNPEDSSESGE